MCKQAFAGYTSLVDNVEAATCNRVPCNSAISVSFEDPVLQETIFYCSTHGTVPTEGMRLTTTLMDEYTILNTAFNFTATPLDSLCCPPGERWAEVLKTSSGYLTLCLLALLSQVLALGTVAHDYAVSWG